MSRRPSGWSEILLLKILSPQGKAGYIDTEGKIQPKFNPAEKGFELKISPDFADINHAIIDVVQSYQFSGHIVNKNNRRTINLNKAVYLDEEFRKLWDKINKKPIYSVEFDTDELIEKTAKSIGRMEKIEPVKIKAIKVGVVLSRKAGLRPKR